jgi:hypothetical protein
MNYLITYNELPSPRDDAGWRLGTAWSEEYPTENQALGRARQLIEAGEHHGVALRDRDGNELSGIRLQLRLGGFSGD